MAKSFQMRLKWNTQGLGVSMNVFTTHYSALIPPTDGQVLSAHTEWAEHMYASLRPRMDSGCVFADGNVVEVEFVDGKLEVVRNVGTISPVLSGTSNTEQLPLTDAGSVFARTDVPKVLGKKRLPGIVEGVQVDGLFTNVLVAALADFALQWLLGPVPGLLTPWASGVMSTALQAFVKFAGQAVVSNIPGTQVTRKPLRGI